MRNLVILLALTGTLLTSPAFAEKVSLELKDYDDELMKTLEQTIKYFEPDITGENISGIKEDASILFDGFKYTEQYFTKKGNYPDAVKWSQDGQTYVSTVLKQVADKNFEAAAEAARGATQSCKSCHDVYKPNQAR